MLLKSIPFSVREMRYLFNSQQSFFCELLDLPLVDHRQRTVKMLFKCRQADAFHHAKSQKQGFFDLIVFCQHQ